MNLEHYADFHAIRDMLMRLLGISKSEAKLKALAILKDMGECDGMD